MKKSTPTSAPIGDLVMILGADKKTFRVERKNRQGICSGQIRDGRISYTEHAPSPSRPAMAQCLKEMGAAVTEGLPKPIQLAKVAMAKLHAEGGSDVDAEDLASGYGRELGHDLEAYWRSLTGADGTKAALAEARDRVAELELIIDSRDDGTVPDAEPEPDDGGTTVPVGELPNYLGDDPA